MLYKPLACFVSAGVCALGVPKQRVGKDAVIYAGDIEVHQRALPSAQGMYGLCDEFLASAGLSGNEHGLMCLRDGLDFGTWQLGYLTGTTWAQGDFDLNSTVDGFDFGIWQLNYLKALGVCSGMDTAAAGAVPEPMTLSLLAIGALAFVRRRR